MRVSSRQFYENWIIAVKENEQKLTDNWRNSTVFTSLIRGEIDSVLSKIAQSGNVKRFFFNFLIRHLPIITIPSGKITGALQTLAGKAFVIK